MTTPTPISPWSAFARLKSPDGRYVAVFDDATEIAMGGPTRGRLVLRTTADDRALIEIPDASASFVWSSDSMALAVPRWTGRRDQRLCIVRVPSGEIDEIEGRFAVLQLESFDGHRVAGVDSPMHRPRRIDLSVESSPAQ